MLKINESVTAFDVAEVLQDESGIFEATSPQGERYQLICRSGHSITNFRPLERSRGRTAQAPLWRLRSRAFQDQDAGGGSRPAMDCGI